MNNGKWIFFDLGWTLVDETGAHRVRLETVSKMLAGFGRSYRVEELIRLSEQASTDFAPSPFFALLDRLPISEAQVAAIRTAARYGKECEELYPGVKEILTLLAKNYRLGVIANQSAGTEERLKRWGIHDYFSVVFSSTERGLEKPDPRIFSGALAEAGCRLQDAVMVGDRLDNDIRPAKSLGWRTIRVRQGHARFQEPRSAVESPDIVIENITQLPAAMARVWVYPDPRHSTK
ncbi:MAG: HAD family hydrolase [Phycisphaeraceae bacterium]|nr:HAD family hydrolase [Phycisphaeraceae bacterium]